jgi:hypothetical protein
MKFTNVKEQIRYYADAICEKHNVKFSQICAGRYITPAHRKALREISEFSVLTQPCMLITYFGIRKDLFTNSKKR